MATGYATRDGRRRIAVTIPEELFQKINGRAKEQGVPFSTVAADLLACGELCIWEMERDEERKVS